METVTLSTDYALHIPPSVRKSMNFLPGQKFLLSIHDQKLELIPCEPLETLEGFVKGMDTDIESIRERNERL